MGTDTVVLTPNTNSSPISTNLNSANSSNGNVFTKPIEDTSGLDVFAQIAASAHPLPLEPVRRASIATSSIVHQSQSQLAQLIYQNQQALRLQQQQKQQQQQQFNRNPHSEFNNKRTISSEDEDYD